MYVACQVLILSIYFISLAHTTPHRNLTQGCSHGKSVTNSPCSGNASQHLPSLVNSLQYSSTPVINFTGGLPLTLNPSVLPSFIPITSQTSPSPHMPQRRGVVWSTTVSGQSVVLTVPMAQAPQPGSSVRPPAGSAPAGHTPTPGSAPL